MLHLICHCWLGAIVRASISYIEKLSDCLLHHEVLLIVLLLSEGHALWLRVWTALLVDTASCCIVDINRRNVLRQTVFALHALLHFNFHLLLLAICLVLEQSHLALDSDYTGTARAQLLVIKGLDQHPIARILLHHILRLHVRNLW